MDFSENINVIFEKLHSFFKTETVVGKPLEVGNVTLVPIISVSFGAGGGSGSSERKEIGGGAGGGGKITANAILVIQKDEVKVIHLNNSKNSLEKIIDMVPEIVTKSQKENATI